MSNLMVSYGVTRLDTRPHGHRQTVPALQPGHVGTTAKAPTSSRRYVPRLEASDAKHQLGQGVVVHSWGSDRAG